MLIYEWRYFLCFRQSENVLIQQTQPAVKRGADDDDSCARTRPFTADHFNKAKMRFNLDWLFSGGIFGINKIFNHNTSRHGHLLLWKVNENFSGEVSVLDIQCRM